jgi:hypothetical protein
VKKHFTTLLLLVFAIGLGVWLWLDRNKVSEGERKSRETSAFPAWRKDEVSRVTIAHESETIVLERDTKKDTAWRLKSPRDERADQAAVERLLTTMEFASIVRRPSEGTNLGLDRPRASGTVVMGGLVIDFVLGAPSPRPEGSSYFHAKTENVIVVSKELTDSLLASSDTYRDRTVAPYLSLDLASFSVSYPEGAFALERADERTFKVADLGVVASRDALDKVWSALAEMRAESFPKEADVDRLVGSPRMTITLRPKDGRPSAVLVAGDACPGHPEDVVILRKEPSRIAACAPKGAIESLRMKPADLVDRRPFSFRADEIEELRLEDLAKKEATIEIARKGTGFHERQPTDRDLTTEEADAANELVGRIAASTAESATRPDPSAPPFEAVGKVTVTSGSHSEIVEVGKPDADKGGKVTLRRVRDDARLVVNRATARRLLPRASSLAPRALLGDERRVTRMLLACGARQEFKDEGNGLRLVDPPGYETDGTVLQIVDALTRGKVEEWIADSDDGSFGLSSDACRVVLSFADGNDPATIRFGGETTNAVYGIVEGKKPYVFLVGKAIRDMATKLYVNRAAMAVAVPGLYADDVLAIGSTNIGKVEVELGPPNNRIRCGPIRTEDAHGEVKKLRPCTVGNLKVVYLLADARLAVALDGGSK